MLVTPLTQSLGLRAPLVQGGMQWVGTPKLAAAVSNAGALGILTALTQPSPEDLRVAIRETLQLISDDIKAERQHLYGSFGVNITILPTVQPVDYEAYARAALDEGVRIFETAGNNPGPVIKVLKQAGAFVIHKCTTVRHAKTAERIGADMLSIDGFECAGHPGEDDVGGLVLMARAAQELKVPFIASGGIANGQGLAAALALGAAGANMGTRFMCTKESEIHENVKRAIVEADERNTVHIFRSLNNTARVFNNGSIDSWDQQSHAPSLDPDPDPDPDQNGSIDTRASFRALKRDVAEGVQNKHDQDGVNSDHHQHPISTAASQTSSDALPLAPSLSSPPPPPFPSSGPSGWKTLSRLDEDISQADSTIPLAWQCFLTGLIDALLFSRTKVWLGFQTGNMVQFSGNIAQYMIPDVERQPLLTLLRILSIISFFVGSWVGSRLGNKLGHQRRSWMMLTSLLQGLLLFGSAGILLSQPEDLQPNFQYYPAVIMLPAFAMGMQCVHSQKLVSPAFATTVAFTATLSQFASDPYLFAFQFSTQTRARELRLLSIVALCIGAGVGESFLHTKVGLRGDMTLAAGFKLFLVVMWLIPKGKKPPPAANASQA